MMHARLESYSKEVNASIVCQQWSFVPDGRTLRKCLICLFCCGHDVPMFSWVFLVSSI